MLDMLHPLLTDARNVELLKLLLADPRMSVSELARQLRVSAPTVRERLARLEERGVYAGSSSNSIQRRLGCRSRCSSGSGRCRDNWARLSNSPKLCRR
ncbi:winged helix-turn-helix transcriptional regulator [Burkholderia multivorans]|uniref:Winged helix-turn-helix transcriptional regulator n=3 Tax=Burkholderia multivorans TaxID=87883 RepID=A0AAP2HQY7_9BURK|nr:winged helix-turn-helix transcriptional regulator [Burkholderia multivorans]MBU9372551.1 winged helix-turn-helix transcriptional regulator [Burkholderia multivorans]HDR9017891.1 winged helix-turn-helix transcriptional regulator [Burkholderia vietnamiensis]